MNILIDIGHPAHVHYFKNLAWELKQKGHKVIITVKDLPSAKSLLDRFDFNYFVLPKKSDSLLGKVFNQLKYTVFLLKLCKKHKIDLAIGVSITITHLSKISPIKSIAFDDDDDEVQPLFVKWGQPYATELLSPDVLRGKQKRKDVVYYPGYHELAYLHPNRFSPNPDILKELGLQKGETFFIMRFNAFKAHHDIGVSGLTLAQKLQLVTILKNKGKVFITVERDIEPELIEYQLKISPEKVHSLIYYATMFLGDSQTMTSEAAVLGTPSIRCNSFAGRISYLEEEEHKYELTYAFLPNQFDALVLKLKELLSIPNLKAEWQIKRKKLLADKIDVSSFWVWFIENYPASKKTLLDRTQIISEFK